MQEYWNGLSFPSPGDLPDPGIELESPVFDYWYLCLFLVIWIIKLPVLNICWIKEEFFYLNKKIEIRGQVDSCQRSARDISTSRKIGSVLRV